MEMPERMKQLPQYRGFPITATTLVIDGIPHFKSTDPDKIWEFKKDRKCALCGQLLDYWIAFVVSEAEAKSQQVYESPAHEDCIKFAFTICPWLLYSNAKYTNPENIKLEGFTFGASHPDRAVLNARPQKLGIYICNNYENIIIKKPYGNAYRICKVPKAKRIEWIEGV